MCKILVFCILMAFFLSSCTKEIEIDLPAYESKVVVDGWIEDDGFAHVILTRSSPFFTSYDSASIMATFLNHAKVTLFTDNGDSEVLTLFRMNQFFPPFVYRSNHIRGELGCHYQLKVEIGGAVIDASTSIPSSKPEIHTCAMELVSDTTTSILVRLSDVGFHEKFYYTQILTRNIDTQYHPSAFPLVAGNSLGNGCAAFRIDRSNQPDPFGLIGIDTKRNIPRHQFAKTDTVHVKVSSIDQPSFYTLNGIYQDQLNQGNAFSYINNKTTTNIRGGIGRWTGLASTTVRVHY